MAIDTAAKRRNVSRMIQPIVMGLPPSSGLDTADRVNAARCYIGIDYQDEAPPEPEPEVTGGANIRRKSGIGR